MDFDPSAPAGEDAGIFGLDTSLADAAVVLLPVPFDATTSYGQGTHRGPAAMLAASHQVDLFDMDYGRPYEAGIHMVQEAAHLQALNRTATADAALARAGGAGAAAATARVNAAGAEVNAWLHAACTEQLLANKIVGTIGGDHSVPFAAIAAHVAHYPDLSVLHIDAHADLRGSYEGFAWSHASIMHNVLHHTPLKKLVQVGLRDLCEPEFALIQNSGGRVQATYDRDFAAHAMTGRPFLHLAGQVVDRLSQDVYISFDIDGLDPTLCPHTGTPVPGGLSFREVLALLHAVGQSGRRVVGFDLNEVAPGPAGDTWDANVGARLIYKMCGLALTSADRKNARPRSIGF